MSTPGAIRLEDDDAESQSQHRFLDDSREFLEDGVETVGRGVGKCMSLFLKYTPFSFEL